MADRFPLIVDSSAQQLQELAVGDNLNLASSGLINADNIQTSGLSVGVMTATSFIGDGSQLTNLPAAGSSTELTASGTLADGSKVIVNADGTVSVVAQTETTGAGAEVAYFETDNSSFVASAYDSTNNRVVIAYSDDGNSSYGTAVVGTVSGTSISFGTPVVFESNSTAGHMSVTYDSTNNKVVIAYAHSGNSWYGHAIVGTVSGTSISFGSSTVFESAASSFISAVYDSTNQKVVISYRDNGNSYYGTAVVGTVSGTSISFGTPVTFTSAMVDHMSSAYDSANGKVVIVYSLSGVNDGTAIVGTVSGTSISFGTAVTYNSSHSYYNSATYDSTNGKVVIAFADVGNSYYGTAIVGTVSGTSISFGTPVVFQDSTLNNGGNNPIAATYDSNRNEVVIAYHDYENSCAKVVTGTVSGNSASFGTPVKFHPVRTSYLSAVYDSTNQKVVISGAPWGNSSGISAVFGATGFSIPSVSSPVAYQSASTYGPSYSSAVYDPNNQRVVIVYRDADDNNYSKAVVGTVSGDTITFGTSSTWLQSAASDFSSVYDSTNQRIVVCYVDNGDSGKGKAVVGTVNASTNAITFGTPVQFKSGQTVGVSAAYDSTNNKVVVAYSDSAISNWGRVRVGIVDAANETILFNGSVINFNTNYTYSISTIYDASNNRLVFAYGASTGYGTAIVGQISGDYGINFGTPTVFNSANTGTITGTYDSNNQRVVIAYQDSGNSNYGTSKVGEVNPSTNAITFGPRAIYNTSSSSIYATIAYDSTNQKVIVAHRGRAGSYNVTAVLGTVNSSNNSIIFGARVILEPTAAFSYISSTFDSTNGKVVFAYTGGYDGNAVVYSPTTIGTNLTAENYIGISDGAYTNGQTATVQLIGSVDDAQSSLTPGQKYYVQDNGTLAESGSVLAGTAIASTKLLIKK